MTKLNHGQNQAVTVENTSTDDEVKNCAHRWLLEKPTNGVVPGKCKHCGITREFKSEPQLMYENGRYFKRKLR